MNVPHSQKGQGCLLSSLISYVTMIYSSQDIKMGKAENQIFFVDRGSPSGRKLTLKINHLEVETLCVHKNLQ